MSNPQLNIGGWKIEVISVESKKDSDWDSLKEIEIKISHPDLIDNKRIKMIPHEIRQTFFVFLEEDSIC